MYGIVNKAIQELVIENYGEERWERIRIKSQVNVSAFLSTEQYADEVTFRLATAASEELGVPLRDILMAFGEYWILNTGKKHYGQLMQAGGTSLIDFLKNLPNFHSRVMLYYPNISPPEFKVSLLGENELQLSYYSVRRGLADFVEGLIVGIAKMFGRSVIVSVVERKVMAEGKDVFHIELQG